MIRKQFGSDFKAKVALEAVKGNRTASELCSEFKVHGTQIAVWKKQLLAGLPLIFSKKLHVNGNDNMQSDELYKEIGKLKVENDFLKKTAYPF